MRNLVLKLAMVACSVGTIAATPVLAEDATAATEEAGGSDFTLTGGVALTTDYRFRGVSLNGKDFAVQPTLTLKHSSGLYAGAWGSNISPNPGSDIELDLYAGFAGGSSVTYDVGVTRYTYPGATGLAYVETYGKLGHTLGPVTAGVQVYYVPEQNNTGNNDNIYVGGSLGAGLPGTPITVNATAGYEDGAFGNKKIDWTLGASYVAKGFTLTAAYVDSNRDNVFALGDGKAGAVFTIGYSF
jgi:uncharacterized protein (TIGR02001 family)